MPKFKAKINAGLRVRTYPAQSPSSYFNLQTKPSASSLLDLMRPMELLIIIGLHIPRQGQISEEHVSMYL